MSMIRRINKFGTKRTTQSTEKWIKDNVKAALPSTHSEYESKFKVEFVQPVLFASRGVHAAGSARATRGGARHAANCVPYWARVYGTSFLMRDICRHTSGVGEALAQFFEGRILYEANHSRCYIALEIDS